MHHFFIKEKLDTKFKIPEYILHQMINVLKFNNSTEFIVVNNETFYKCVLQDEWANIVEKLDYNNESNKNITLVIGSLKLKKIELIIQKTTEIGIDKIIILQMERSISNYEKQKEKKLDRWKKIAIEASEQSKRNKFPKIIYLDKISMLNNYLLDNNIVCYENEKNNKFEIKRNTLVLIGPEGGITNNEITILTKMGFKIQGLTKTILRSETAAIYAISRLIN